MIQQAFIWSLCLLFFLQNKINAQTDLLATTVVNNKLLDSENPTEQFSEICVIRKTGLLGSAIPFRVFIDGESICKLNFRRFSIHKVVAGEHKIAVAFYGKKPGKKVYQHSTVFSSNKTHFILLKQKMGFWRNELYCGEVLDQDYALKLIAGMREDKKCK